MKVRRLQLDKDYPTIRQWWERRGTAAPQESILPPIGVISEQDSVPIACAFLYEVKGVSVAWVEWEATNPEFRAPLIKIRALNQVFDFFEGYAKETGIAALFSWVASDHGDGRLLGRRKWIKCPGERHELMVFTHHEQEAPCPS